MSELPQSFVDHRLREVLPIAEERAEVPKPVTLAEAMEFARLAYMCGYWDSVRGVDPDDDLPDAA